MSFQIGVLKVLSSYPDGRASVDTIKRDLAMLASREWNAQLRRLAALAPRINVFSAGLILRTPDAWQITEAGQAFLSRLQGGEPIDTAPHQEQELEPELESASMSASPLSRPQWPLVRQRSTIEIRRPEPRRRPLRPIADTGTTSGVRTVIPAESHRNLR